tara:strand:- start:861 stop:1460 length:600 start_codon:yes stop_codon:yes gene_type:complete
MAKAKPVAKATEKPEVEVKDTGIIGAVRTKIDQALNKIFDGLSRAEQGTREFAALLNEQLPKEWYLIENPTQEASQEAKQIRPYRALFIDSYTDHGKSRNTARQGWKNVRKYAHEAADPEWAAEQAALEVAKKEAKEGNGAHANAPKDPTPRIIDDVFPVYKFLYKAETLSPSENKAMGLLREALQLVGAPLADFEDKQ